MHDDHLTPSAHPVRLQATLDAPLSRWLWLLKWVLVIPHAIALVFLWIAFGALSVVAFVAILVTGTYPRAIFDVNVGVLRWSWRVGYYSYSALATDRYPPFTLAAVPDYPAQLEVEYPRSLSRRLVLLKWWLLALPHYVIVGVLASVRSLLVLVAGVLLAVTGRYPSEAFDLALGIDRWIYRVVAYAGLMTDTYPPFRLDIGGQDPQRDTAGLGTIGPDTAPGVS
jgi:hypothetical protein